MSTEKDIKKKWAELLDFAKQHATKNGLRTGIKWLEDCFNEYLDLSDTTPGYGMGGQPGSQHNRQVLAERIVLALGPYVGGQHLLNDAQLSHLKESLNSIVNNQVQTQQLRR